MKLISKIYEVLKATVFWSYERGTWQYDILCVAILSFIFFIPTSFFDERDKIPQRDKKNVKLNYSEEYLSLDDVKEVSPETTIKEVLEKAYLHKYGTRVFLERFEIVADEKGTVTGYQVCFTKG